MSKASQWVQENVIAHLITGTQQPDIWKTKAAIRQDILSFMDIKKYGKPELWAYYADYDHVVFCQLFGTMMDLPEGFPMYTNDLQQSIEEQYVLPSDLPPQPSNQHNALADALWVRDAWRSIYR